MLELASGIGTDRRRILAMPSAGDIMRGAAVRTCDQSAELDSVTGYGGMTGNRRLARALERSKECAFASNSGRCIRVVDAGKRIQHPLVVLARFDADRTLPHRRQKFINA